MRRRLTAAVLLVAVVVPVLAPAAWAFAPSPGAMTLTGPAGQALADDVGTATAEGIGSLGATLLPLGGLVAILGAGASASDSGDARLQSNVDQRCASDIKGNAGYPPWSTGDFTGPGPESLYGNYPDQTQDGGNSNLYCDPFTVFPTLYDSGIVVASEPWIGRFCATVEVDDGGGSFPPAQASSLGGTHWSWLATGWDVPIAPPDQGGGPFFDSAQSALDWLNTACPPSWLQKAYGAAYAPAVAGAPASSGTGGTSAPGTSTGPGASATATCNLDVGPSTTGAACTAAGAVDQGDVLQVLDDTRGIYLANTTLWGQGASAADCQGPTSCNPDQASVSQAYSTSAPVQAGDTICAFYNVGYSFAGHNSCTSPNAADVDLNITIGDGSIPGSFPSPPAASPGPSSSPTTTGTPVTSPATVLPYSAPKTTIAPTGTIPSAGTSSPTDPQGTSSAAPIRVTDSGDFAWLGGVLSGLFSGVIGIVGDIDNDLVNGVNAIVGTVSADMTDLWDITAEGFQQLTSAVGSIATDLLDGLPDLLTRLFVPSTSTVAQLSTEQQTVFPMSWVTALLGGLQAFSGDLTGGLANGACGPRIGFDGAGAVPGFHVRFPAPSALDCPGNTSDGNGPPTAEDNSAGDLFGYRVLARDGFLAVMLIAFAIRVIRAGPWSAQPDDLAPSLDAEA